jgi:hypothetical protein
LAGWLFSRPNIERFPDVGASDHLLILAPHIDDETVGVAGLIQRAILYSSRNREFLKKFVRRNEIFEEADK